MKNLKLRALTAALNGNGNFKYKPPESVVDFLVVGGGVVGLAIAQRLSQRFPTLSTCLVERHPRAGEEISSRNSEVIHSGLYYPADSLKTRLCLRGRDMIYERCKTHHIPYRKCGKLVVARRGQQSYIENLYRKSLTLSSPPQSNPTRQPVLPTTLLSGKAAQEFEPDISEDIIKALWCPETGILDSHAFMESLEKDIIDSEGGDLVYSTKVVRIDRYQRPNTTVGAPGLEPREDGWVVQTVTGTPADDSSEGDSLLARTLINASGLSSALVLNSILPDAQRIPLYYARGSYASYHGIGIQNVSHLIYPCPELGGNEHAFHSLGTHLTLDLQGKVRFGPDIEWIEPPSNNPEDSDFWTAHLAPDESRLAEMHQAVTQYLPGVKLEGMQPDYCGMRPKLVPPGGGFQDFVFRADYSTSTSGRRRAGAMISLLGIESPGLTSSLAIAEYVVEDILRAGNWADSVE
ncbi:hypothetical protein H0H81_005004 [Sphagnurus paluster]|uniref:L-2-hydroxyglutarate dehydrogenase, mitochondrial n=1 Tax=Sphagnurus paluster TaxID=117069 RepID=A0A9P7FUG4_9AGAR|nr:hypothetical protein H0H81_005004 [Sphagnurus paluster]